MPMLDDQQLLDAAAQRIATGSDQPRPAPVKQQDLDDAVAALGNLKNLAELQTHDPVTRSTAFVAVTRSTDVNTDRGYAAFLDARPDVAQRSVDPQAFRALIAIDGGLGSVAQATDLAQGGFVQVVIDENTGLDPVANQLLDLFNRKDIKTEICPGITVGVAQVILGETKNTFDSLVVETDGQQQRKNSQKNKAAASVDNATAAAAAQAKIALLKQTARSGKTLPAPQATTTTKAKTTKAKATKKKGSKA